MGWARMVVVDGLRPRFVDTTGPGGRAADVCRVGGRAAADVPDAGAVMVRARLASAGTASLSGIGVDGRDAGEAARLRRVRWEIRGVMVLSVAVSVGANVLHAQRNVISQVIAAWAPVAMLLAIELISRVSVSRRALGVVRLVAAGLLALIAGLVSYRHTFDVVARYGEDGFVPYLLPLSVDGLMVVASVCLGETTGKIMRAEAATVAGSGRESVQMAASQGVAPAGPVASGNHGTRGASPPAEAGASPPPVGSFAGARPDSEIREMANAYEAPPAGPTSDHHGQPSNGEGSGRVTEGPGDTNRSPSEGVAFQPDDGLEASPTTAGMPRSTTSGPGRRRGRPPTPPDVGRSRAGSDGPAAGARKQSEGARPVSRGRADSSSEVDAPDRQWSGTTAEVAYWRSADPALKPKEVADRIGKSERTVFRHWQKTAPPEPTQSDPDSA